VELAICDGLQRQRECNTLCSMSHTVMLSKTRTVRLSAETDRQIEAVAAQKGKTASDVIRETLEAEFSTPRETPGQWLLRTARLPQTRKPDAKFSSAYRRRHQ
jgi:hypothetical protein